MDRDAEELTALSESGAPLGVQREALVAYLARRGVTDASIAVVLEHTRDGVVLRPTERDARTRIGGQALLPDGVAWPIASTGNPMSFVAAFDFAELPPLDPLPRTGTLVVYWNFSWFDAPRDVPGQMDMLRATRTYWLADGDGATRPEAPDGAGSIRPTPLRGTLAPVPGEATRVATKLGDAVDARSLFEAMNDLSAAGFFGSHRILGASQDIQWTPLDAFPSVLGSDLFSDESRARFSPEELRDTEWLMLGQLNQRDGLIIADGGSIYLLMLARDLAARRFDRIVGWMDSH
jgi:Domain of unknown function (DUF1963)